MTHEHGYVHCLIIIGQTRAARERAELQIGKELVSRPSPKSAPKYNQQTLIMHELSLAACSACV